MGVTNEMTFEKSIRRWVGVTVLKVKFTVSDWKVLKSINFTVERWGKFVFYKWGMHSIWVHGVSKYGRQPLLLQPMPVWLHGLILWTNGIVNVCPRDFHFITKSIFSSSSAPLLMHININKSPGCTQLKIFIWNSSEFTTKKHFTLQLSTAYYFKSNKIHITTITLPPRGF